MSVSTGSERQSLGVAVLTVSDTRTEENDTSGQYLVDSLLQEGHRLSDKQIVIDDIYLIRAVISQWIANADVQAILITGGTGFTGRDSTPEAVSVLFDKTVEGFGELFRYLSYDEIGTSTVQSRAIAGLANETVIFCMPGSTSACQTAWGKIIREQLDSTYRPCNFVGVLKTRAEQKDA
ncbi:MAG: molybdenum cofactor biosynthesis protein B [Oceanicoccus sp.]|uniref:molybdenum cofactor biosynthesis protein B n=1 Tax=Oceanicoccus sp. TaxID=2691044 RepID=UPI00262554DD|nr:molybdenum cofactor biosynthesis protein B [Oceanicoccus sp.]MCP3907749.1 molybdenum cofactor biosynthesis protein B [Oceanicoccus sp.]MDG1772684.1 molybdenum cofactor biosynthesis protein B [Oceanicoccus sp.]